MSHDQVLEVWGELACFSPPTLKVERFSYPVITPSAARGIYDAVYCKPNKDPSQAEFHWQVTQIELMSWSRRFGGVEPEHPQYIALRRNEVRGWAPVDAVVEWMSGKEPPQPLFADETAGNKGRTQRQTMALKKVRYRLHARIHPWAGFEHKLGALEAQFHRRAAHGKCVHQPYLGCREFPAYFELAEGEALREPPLAIDMDIGLMLYDVFDLSAPQAPLAEHDEARHVSLFRATMKSGVLDVPDYESDAVLKGGGGENA